MYYSTAQKNTSTVLRMSLANNPALASHRQKIERSKWYCKMFILGTKYLCPPEISIKTNNVDQQRWGWRQDDYWRKDFELCINMKHLAFTYQIALYTYEAVPHMYGIYVGCTCTHLCYTSLAELQLVPHRHPIIMQIVSSTKNFQIITIGH